jgi:hypothetical protein
LRTKPLFAMVEPEVKTLVEKIAATIGVSQSDYVRHVVLRDLEKRGYLKETASLEQTVPLT